MKPDKENSTGLSSDHAKLPETKCISDITGNPCGIAQTLHDQWALVRLLSFWRLMNRNLTTGISFFLKALISPMCGLI